MTDKILKGYTCFAGHYQIAAGDWQTVSLAAQQAIQDRVDGAVLIFDDRTGRLTDVVAASSVPIDASDGAEAKETIGSRGRGRPKLGVTPREVTLLPRHWEWLATQPGGASVTLRRLVEEARRAPRDRDTARKAQERTYAFIGAVAGDLPDFEEASRALFANDLNLFSQHINTWPEDVRNYALSLASTHQSDGLD